jgi:hypothetical protein
MSQNNSDNAALHTAHANIADATIKINRLEYKLERLNAMLKEIVEASNIEGATQLTTSVMIKHKIEQAQKIINE